MNPIPVDALNVTHSVCNFYAYSSLAVTVVTGNLGIFERKKKGGGQTKQKRTKSKEVIL